MLETMPEKNSETRHMHAEVEQFFYIPEGTATMDLNDEGHHLCQEILSLLTHAHPTE